jgi:hypothetical protein
VALLPSGSHDREPSLVLLRVAQPTDDRSQDARIDEGSNGQLDHHAAAGLARTREPQTQRGRRGEVVLALQHDHTNPRRIL